MEAIRRQIASGVDILIHLGRMRDKSRKLLEVTEVCGFENGEIQIRPLYQWQEGKGLVKTDSLLQVEKLERAGTVYYTHLDVYKRQGCIILKRFLR